MAVTYLDFPRISRTVLDPRLAKTVLLIISYIDGHEVDWEPQY